MSIRKDELAILDEKHVVQILDDEPLRLIRILDSGFEMRIKPSYLKQCFLVEILDDRYAKQVNPFRKPRDRHSEYSFREWQYAEGQLKQLRYSWGDIIDRMTYAELKGKTKFYSYIDTTNDEHRFVIVGPAKQSQQQTNDTIRKQVD